MGKFLLKEVLADNIDFELSQIGFDQSYRFKACNKFRYKNIKVFDLSCAQANILKQIALIYGADCAVNRNVITGNIEKSDVILCGSYSQLKKIADKLKCQPFSLKDLGVEIIKCLEHEKTRETKLAGILNITPDSFSDGGLYFKPEDAQKHLISLIEDGADIIDIGAESTRPYSDPVSSLEQIKRLKHVLEFIQHEGIKTPISVDTRSSEVADFALNNGASIINDVSGFDYDNKLPDVISRYNAAVIIQHSQGNPQNMQDSPVYKNVCEDIFLSLYKKIQFAKEKGINNIIVDPGVGFGKTKEDNFQILNKIEEFFLLACPIMVGISRKRFLGVESEDNDLKDSLSAAIALPLINKGVDYLRVHNVKLHRSLITMLKNI